MFGRWWNRLTESDHRRLRRLETEQQELADQLTLTSERLVRLDARLRKRSNRALQEIPEEPADEAIRTDGRGPDGESPAPVISKDRLRELARARGLLPH